MGSVRQLLRDQGIRPRKGLGQHFLIDDEAVQAIVDAAAVTPEDTVVEVGPGPGILTPLLADRAGKLIAVELDRKVIPALKELALQHPNLEIRLADILATDPGEFPSPYAVVGNLPYYITSAVLKHFLETANRPKTMTVTIQSEVADRIVAKPPKMSVLAVSVQLYGDVTVVARIPREAFWPAPAVDSAVLRVENIGENLAQTIGKLTEQEFFRVVKAGFAEKRKQLHNSLARNLDLSHDETTAVLDKAGIDSKRRAETLTVPEWVELAHACTK